MNLFYERYWSLMESLSWPVSVRTEKFKKQFSEFARNPRFVETYTKLYKRVEEDPEQVRELTAFDSASSGNVSLYGKFYKLEINPPGQNQYRAIAFEPSSCNGLLIWFWVGTHEQYNNEWRTQIRKVPSDWAAQAPYLVHACKSAKLAKQYRLPSALSRIEAQKTREANKIAALKRQQLRRRYQG